MAQKDKPIQSMTPAKVKYLMKETGSDRPPPSTGRHPPSTCRQPSIAGHSWPPRSPQGRVEMVIWLESKRRSSSSPPPQETSVPSRQENSSSGFLGHLIIRQRGIELSMHLSEVVSKACLCLLPTPARHVETVQT